MTTASVTDPYSVSLAANSTHSQIVDLSDAALQPAGWSAVRKPPAPARPQIQELHVRDFSVADTTVPQDQRGTYLAFTQAQSAGMTHLRELAQAGTSYVHLLPVFDIATIPERRADQLQPPCDLAALPPDSSQQQACIAQIAEQDGYNWGYDPLHYSTPEGSYATDPQGTPRINQFRQMVAGINGAGLRVVVDVVYNHTTAAGTDPHSVLDQIVPGYYHRLLDDGTVANSTCCANTAPENAMMGKLVVDSVVLWAKQYKVDGFRFDLMGHHPKANILAVRAALDQLTLGKDGVDGKKILIYGEGWNFGEVANDARFVQATQTNMAGTGIGTFNDRLRDAVRGGGPFDGDPRIQGFASGLYTAPNGDPANGSTAEQRARLLHYQDLIQVGLTGNLAAYEFIDSTGHRVTGAQVDYNGSPAGYTRLPAEGVTYVDAHDNEILYDALAYKLPPGTTAEQRARLQVLALSTTVFGQGTGFVTTGSDLLRSKSLDRNSFNSGDWFNQIRWDCAGGNGFGSGLPPAADNQDKWSYAQPLLANPALVPDCAAIDLAAARFQELLRIRASSPAFALGTAAQVQQRVAFPLSGTSATPGVITMTLDARGLDPRYRTVVVVFNAGATAATQTVGGYAGAQFALHPVQATSADPSRGRPHSTPRTARSPSRRGPSRCSSGPNNGTTTTPAARSSQERAVGAVLSDVKAFTVAGLLLVALLAGATGKPSPPPGPPLPGPPAILEPGAPPSTLPTLSRLSPVPSVREPSGRSVAPPASESAPPAEPSVKATSSPSPVAKTGVAGGRRGGSGSAWSSCSPRRPPSSYCDAAVTHSRKSQAVWLVTAAVRRMKSYRRSTFPVACPFVLLNDLSRYSAATEHTRLHSPHARADIACPL